MQLYRKIFEQSQFLIHPVHALVRRATKNRRMSSSVPKCKRTLPLFCLVLVSGKADALSFLLFPLLLAHNQLPYLKADGSVGAWRKVYTQEQHQEKRSWKPGQIAKNS